MEQAKRRQLRDQCKRKATIGAVYCITCSGNGRRMLKATPDIGGIRNRFQFAMNINGCPDPVLQAEWKAYGNASFTLTVLEELPMKEDQTSREFADDLALLLDMWQEKSAAND